MLLQILASIGVVSVAVSVVAVSWLGVEWVLRRFHGRVANTEPRAFDPHLIAGDFCGDDAHQNVALDSVLGPKKFGYEFNKGFFIYNTDVRIPSASVRSRFLFEHYLSRYKAEDVDLLTAMDPNAVRIFVIGGSVAMGSSASSPDKTWHAVLENRLRERFSTSSIYVFNAAMGAFVTSQERVAFDLAVAPRRPDVVIAVNGYNDAFTPLGAGVAPGDAILTGRRYGQIYDNSLGRFLRSNSILFHDRAKAQVIDEIGRRSTRLLNDPKQRQAYIQDIADIFTEHNEYLAQRCRDMDAACLVFLQPWHDLGCAEGKAMLAEDAGAFYGAMYTAMADRLARSRFRDSFVDISQSFDTDDLCATFTDIVHNNDDGQVHLAEQMLPHVERTVETALTKQRSQRVGEITLKQPSLEIPFQLEMAAPSPTWSAGTDATEISMGSEGLELVTDESQWHYQLLTPSFAVKPGQDYAVKYRMRVREGDLSLGVLDAEQDSWVTSVTISAGDERTGLVSFRAMSGRVSLIISTAHQTGPTIARGSIAELMVYRLLQDADEPVSSGTDTVWELDRSSARQGWSQVEKELQLNAVEGGLELRAPASRNHILITSEQLALSPDTDYAVEVEATPVAGQMEVGVLDPGTNEWLTRVPLENRRQDFRTPERCHRGHVVLATANPEVNESQAIVQAVRLVRSSGA